MRNNLLYYIKWPFRTLVNSLFFYRNIKRPIKHFGVNIIYWRPYKLFQENVGDYLAKIVVQFVLTYAGLHKNKFRKKTIFFMSIGSGLQFAKTGYIVWGSGIKEEHLINDIINQKIDIRSVRGPKTLNALKKIGYPINRITIGDPAILLPKFYYPKYIKKEYDYGIIPYFLKTKNYTGKYPKVISTLTKDWKTFIKEILKCKFIISSSLHGIIISEAYNVPTIMLDDNLEESDFKFQDYYFSTNRYNYKKAKTIEEALMLGPEALPDLIQLQDNLLNSFPYELWI